MLDEEPGWYWKITWCVLSPLCMIVLFGASIIALAIKTPQYKYYNATTGEWKDLLVTRFLVSLRYWS